MFMLWFMFMCSFAFMLCMFAFAGLTEGLGEAVTVVFAFALAFELLAVPQPAQHTVKANNGRIIRVRRILRFLPNGSVKQLHFV